MGAATLLTTDGRKFSNPLYFKTIIVSILAAWPLVIGCLIVYGYNIYKRSKIDKTITPKIVFFPVLLCAGILDNAYDFMTEAKVSNYNTESLIALIVVYCILGLFSLIYVATYTKESIADDHKGYSLLKNAQSLDEEDGILYDREMVTLPKNIPRYRMRMIIDDYLTANLVWGFCTYNLMLIVVYTARYISHTDNNYMRETDVALISAVVLMLMLPMIVADFFLFRNPSCGCVFAHYAVCCVFLISFTVDFYTQVRFCEFLTLGAFFLSFGIMVYKIFVFIEMGKSPSKKIN